MNAVEAREVRRLPTSRILIGRGIWEPIVYIPNLLLASHCPPLASPCPPLASHCPLSWKV